MEAKQGFKIFNVRMPKEMWLFLKNLSTNKEISMNQIVLAAIGKYRRELEEKKPTPDK